jgi:hypothetical protein
MRLAPTRIVLQRIEKFLPIQVYFRRDDFVQIGPFANSPIDEKVHSQHQWMIRFSTIGYAISKPAASQLRFFELRVNQEG